MRLFCTDNEDILLVNKPCTLHQDFKLVYIGTFMWVLGCRGQDVCGMSCVSIDVKG